VQDGKPERGGEVHLCLPHRIRGGRNQGMDGHGLRIINQVGMSPNELVKSTTMQQGVLQV